MRLGVFACVVAAGCGRLDFAPLPLADAAGAIDDARLDSAATCAWAAWETPAPVPELDVDQNNMGDPALRFDGLEIVVAVQIAGADSLFSATRMNVTDPFGALTPLTALNTTDIENAPAFSGDGLTLYWMTSDIGGIRLRRASRTSLAQLFTNPEDVPGGPFDEQVDPSITADGRELFHSSTLGDLYVSTRTTTVADFGPPTLLGAPIASTRWQEGINVSADGTTLFYAEVDENGLFRIWSTTRADRESPFAVPAMTTELLPDQSWDPELSADGSTLYFSRFVAGERDIWVTRRDCL